MNLTNNHNIHYIYIQYYYLLITILIKDFFITYYYSNNLYRDKDFLNIYPIYHHNNLFYIHTIY